MQITYAMNATLMNYPPLEFMVLITMGRIGGTLTMYGPQALLGYVGLAILTVHFTIPTIYYLMAKDWLSRDWGVRPSDDRDPPFVSIIVPTYNEAKTITEKLSDIASQDYPRDRLEIIVVDSGSIDGTLDRVYDWIRKHGDVRVKVIEEGVRLGKAHALNTALKYAEGDVVVITDADSRWFPDSLRRAIAWLTIDGVGAVSCNKIPRHKGNVIEEEYRNYYGILRIAESKKYSSAIFHGELAAYKKDLLLKIGGFPNYLGADDSHTAGLITLSGFRAIIPEDVRCIEYVPSRGYWSWRIRRAQHLVQNFSKLIGMVLTNRAKPPSDYRPVLFTEAYLHLVNPWLFLVGTALVIASAIQGALLPMIILLISLALLASRFFRTWIVTQIILAIAMIRNIWNKELVWRKEEKD
ncbi:MAG: glycosyltransferase [Vulcanisaeta sp.]|uniref:glycosyltransferase n=1 Tax=Vulcanisaeta sp. TaxID=2020871 RepID=UPI003D0D8168